MSLSPHCLRPAARWGGLLLLAATLAGCASQRNAESPVGVAYTGGALVVVEAAPWEQVWLASRTALNDLAITELDVLRTGSGGYIEGQSLDLKKVMVKVRPLDPQKTELLIRVNSFGNEEFARKIYAAIQQLLAPRP